MKVMRCGCEVEVIKSGKWPCGVCGKGVGGNSIQCIQCKVWIHKRCSGIKGRISSNGNFKCVKCDGAQAVDTVVDKKISLILEQGVECEYVSKFLLPWRHD